MKTTLPFELFSNGTTPLAAVPDCTALKMSGMVRWGDRRIALLLLVLLLLVVLLLVLLVLVAVVFGGKAERAA